MDQPNRGPWREPAPEGGLYLVTGKDGTPATGTAAEEPVFYCFSFRSDAERLVSLRAPEQLAIRVVYQSDVEWLRDWLASSGVQRALVDWGGPRSGTTASRVAADTQAGDPAPVLVPAAGLVNALAAGMATNVVKSWQP